MPRRIRASAMLGGTFFTSQNGTLKITSPSAPETLAGVARAFDLALSFTTTTGVYLAINTQAAYRLCWGVRDTNNNLVIGAPSGRFTISNVAAVTNGGTVTRDPNITFQIPSDVTTNHIFQIYRTLATASSVDPGDEEQLVYEGNPTFAQVAAGTVTVVDSVPDVFRSTPLHSNATRDGAGQTNDRPPYCRDISRQGDMLLFANTKLLQTYQIQVLGVSNMSPGVSTITIAAVTYTAQNAPALGTGDFGVVFSAGTDSLNTERTAKNLVKVINQFAGNRFVWAYYMSGPLDAPGMIMLQARSFAVPAFQISVNSTATGNAFNPTPPTTPSALVQSSDDNRPNRIYFSKLGQPEAVPNGDNSIDVGGADEEIQRCIQLRDWNAVIKDKSVWKLNGNSPGTLSVFPLDNTVAIVGRDTAVTLNNQVVMLTNQGVVTITDTGVSILSRPIEADLLADVKWSIQQGTTDQWVAVAHESDRSYRLWGPTYQYGDEGGLRVCWKYNTITRAWTREITNANCAAIYGDRVLYGLNNAYGHVLKQRSGYMDATASIGSVIETCDPEGVVVLSSVIGVTATFAFTDSINWDGYYAGFGPGFVVVDGTAMFIVVSVVGATVTFDRVGITAGSKVCYRPIDLNVEWCPRTTGQNFSEKQLTECQIVATTQNAYACTVSFTNETDVKGDQFNQNYAVAPPSISVLIPDTIGLKSNTTPLRRIRTEVDRTRSRGAQIGIKVRHNVAMSRFQVQSVGIETRRTEEAKSVR